MPNLPHPSDELSQIGVDVERLINSVLTEFNSRNIKLIDLSAHQRIFVFFHTRSIKTYLAITELYKTGYGQDISTLLRSLLENLISVKYILADSQTADEKATRFVDYKWVVFKRYISNNLEENPERISDLLMKKLVTKKSTINEKIEIFKKTYKIKSDKALVTWSGRTIRDMAKLSDAKLVEEYDSTFRLSSRFSHPSIIGDRAYIKYIDHSMVFSPFASSYGVKINFKVATDYILKFLEIFQTMFQLNNQNEIKKVQQKFNNLPIEEHPPIHMTTSASLDKEQIVMKFEIKDQNL